MKEIKNLVKFRTYKNYSIMAIIIYFLLIQSTFSSTQIEIDANYLRTFELEGGNIIMCTDKAIYLYIKEQRSIAMQTHFDNTVSYDDFHFVTVSQFEAGRKCVVILYKNMIYIFTEEGQYFTEKSVNFDTIGNYYALVPYKIQINSDNSNYYYFFVGYIKGNQGNMQFMICYFYINNVNGDIVKVNEQSLSITGQESISSFRGFSCETMVSNSQENVLTCFFHVNAKLIISSYDINTFQAIDGLFYETNTDINPIYIRSTLSRDKTKSLVCYLKNWGYNRCDKYDINDNSLTLIYEETTTQCNNQNPSLNSLYHTKAYDEYIFACYGYGHDYNLIKLNSNFEVEKIINNYQYTTSDCDCSTLSITKSLVEENKYINALSCTNNKIIYVDLPEGFIYDKTQKLFIETTIIKESKVTTNLIEETTYIKNVEVYTTNIEEYSTNIEAYSTNAVIDSTNIEINSTDVEIYTTSVVNKYSTQIIAYPTTNLLIDSTKNIKEKSTIIDLLIESKNKTDIMIMENCPKEYLYQNIETKECLNSCSVEELLNNKCKMNFITNSNINNITDNIRNFIKEENLTSDTNIIIEGDNTIYQVISSKKMSENENTNISIIDLGECETILLNEYNLTYLLILKIDTKLNENSAIILNYEVYNPITNEKLNLSLCDSVKINTYSKYYPSEESLSKIKKLSESGYDLYNLNDDFYQDICSSFTSENGTDILLSDRQNDFYENVSLCENDCNYKGYDLNTKRVQCECPVKEEIKVEESTKNNLFGNLFSGDGFSNIKVLKCYKLVFSKKGQKNNKGSIIFLCVILILFISCIIYAINQEKYIASNIRKINNEKYKNNLNNNKLKKQKNLSVPPKKRKGRTNHKNNQYVVFNYIKNNNNVTNSISNIKHQESTKNQNSNFLISEKENNNMKIYQEIKYEIYNFTNEELNSLSYDMACLYDKRTYFQYYISLLRQKHLIIFTFCNNQDYNIFLLKFSLFLSSFSLYFAVNALFFNDDTMHTIYEQKGNTGIFSQISNIFYSTIISCFINIIIKKLGLSNDDMVRIKQIPNNKEGLRQSSLLMKKLKIKFGIFFLISFLLVSFFWYFISAFCAVYQNTQNILIENTLSSFALSLLYPFGLNLIPGLLRIPSLKNHSGCSKCIYFISKIIALI